MATVNLTNPQEEIITGNDNIVIIDNFQSIRGGRSLNVDGYPHDVIHAGHVIIKDAAGEYYPMPLNVAGDAYGTLPLEADGTTPYKYAGILIASIPTSRPFAGIMVRGTVNVNASPFPLDNILNDVKAALPLIVFTSDNA